jgi:hypothetical protein
MIRAWRRRSWRWLLWPLGSTAAWAVALTLDLGSGPSFLILIFGFLFVLNLGALVVAVLSWSGRLPLDDDDERSGAG